MTSSKPVVYLLPGLLCDAEYWQPQKQALSPFAEVRIPLFKNHDSLSSMAESVLRDAPERFSVVGHSMGGRVAWELLKQAGNRIDKFAVMDTGTHGVQEGEPEKRQKFLDLARQDMQSLLDFWIPPMIHPDRANDKQLVSIIEAMGHGYTYEQFHGQIKALLGREDQGRYLPEIEHEVLLICGEQDQWSTVAQHQGMLEKLKHGRLEIIKDSGHMATIEQPEQVNKVLVDWITS